MTRRWIYMAPLAIIGIVIFMTIGGVVVQLLWNWLLPPLFGWPPITFWQALGLLALSRILFGGFRSHVGHRSWSRRRMLERWDRMTPEEKERFRQGMRGRCGFEDAAPTERDQATV